MATTTTRATSTGRGARATTHKRRPTRRRVARSAEQQGGAVVPEVRRAMIAEAAYFRAEARGFAPGGELEDWLEAEKEVDARLPGA
jgi:hypothetical protein